MQAAAKIRYRKAHCAPKIKAGGITVVSQALVKKGVSNLVPKAHVKRGDMVMLMKGPKKNDKKRLDSKTKNLAERNAFAGSIGKVIAVYPKEGKVLVEGVNLMTHFVRPKTALAQAGIIRKEMPLPISRVMLYDPEAKRPIRASKRKAHKL